MGDHVVEDKKIILINLAFNTHRILTVILAIVSIAGLFFSPVIPLVILLLYTRYLFSEAQRVFMQEFARVNNLAFEERGKMASVSARLFKSGNMGSQSIYNIISTQHTSQPIRIFNFQYSTGSGKSKQVHTFTVCEVAFEKVIFPYILLQSSTMWKYGGTDFFGDDKDRDVPLEGEFKDSFHLHVRQGYETEALQIFSPDVLHFLKEQASKFSIEFAGNNVYVYDDYLISTQERLNELYSVVRKMIDMVSPLLNRLADDFSALDEVYRKENKQT